MGFIKFTKKTSLSEEDRKALQDLLNFEKQKLKDELKDVEDSLKALRASKKKKSKKKK
ncbi:ABC-type phosphate transport system auxiliary subunit [Bradyrhizobium sp. USDA 4354]